MRLILKNAEYFSVDRLWIAVVRVRKGSNHASSQVFGGHLFVLVKFPAYFLQFPVLMIRFKAMRKTERTPSSQSSKV
jgi:hypothetical protein